MLVIARPCALGCPVGLPIAIMVGTGKGAELGNSDQRRRSPEIAHKVNTVVLDKTGTLTEEPSGDRYIAIRRFE